MSSRRDTTELFFVCLENLVQNENNPDMNRTKLQFLVNTSYDKLKKYLTTMNDMGLIDLTGEKITVTHKGREFYSEYKLISRLKEQIEKKFLVKQFN